MSNEKDMRDDYAGALKEGVRGKYYDRVKDGVRAVILDADVAEVFRDSKQVNEVLRSHLPQLKRKAV